MFKLSTVQWRLATVLAYGVAASAAFGQAVPNAVPNAVSNAVSNVDWRHVGNFVADRALAGPASGPVKRVWFGAGGTLYAQTQSGRVYQTPDLENWQASATSVPSP